MLTPVMSRNTEYRATEEHETCLLHMLSLRILFYWQLSSCIWALCLSIKRVPPRMCFYLVVHSWMFIIQEHQWSNPQWSIGIWEVSYSGFVIRCRTQTDRQDSRKMKTSWETSLTVYWYLSVTQTDYMSEIKESWAVDGVRDRERKGSGRKGLVEYTGREREMGKYKHEMIEVIWSPHPNHPCSFCFICWCVEISSEKSASSRIHGGTWGFVFVLRV